ncbi:MAG: HAD family hydrolase [Pseudomonadota bacterium]
MRIIAWSGPRNLSTAMMYSFASRADCAVMDEPFYAAYLAATDLAHPMREAVLAGQPTDPTEVAARCAAEPTGHVYQKHMAHHMCANFPLDWTEGAVHMHLIRHPARVIASYGDKRATVAEADLGFAAQASLFDRLGGVVLDTSDLRAAPDPMLRRLCAALGLDWDPAMLSWPKGGNDADGIWAAHWYGSVHRSTGFAGPEGSLPQVARTDLLRAAMPFYQALKARSLQPSDQSAS